jgi:TctA family transporter
MFFCCIGVYSLNNSANEVLFICFFGVVGYILMKLDWEPAPLLLGFILGPMIEENMRRALIISRGDPMTFVTRPLSAVLLAFFALLGYLFLRSECEPAPLLLGFILGPLLEEHFRRSMIVSRGDPTIFFTHPLSAATLVLALIILVVATLPKARAKRDEVFVE